MEIYYIGDKEFTKHIKRLCTTIEKGLIKELNTRTLTLPHRLTIQNHFLSLCHYDSYINDTGYMSLRFFTSEFKEAQKTTYKSIFNTYMLKNIK